MSSTDECPEIVHEFLSIVAYLDSNAADAALIACELLDICEPWISESRADLDVHASLEAQRNRDQGDAHPFWTRHRQFGSLVRELRNKPIADIRELLKTAPDDESRIRITWKRRRNQPREHFPHWHLAIEPAHRVDDEDDGKFAVVGVTVRRDLVTDPQSAPAIAAQIFSGLQPRGCYHGIVDLAPETHTRAGYGYGLLKYRPLTWLRLIADDSWRLLGDARRQAVRAGFWGTYLNAEVLEQLGPEFEQEFMGWPPGSSQVRFQQFHRLPEGALLLLSDNILDISEFGHEIELTPDGPFWEGPDEFAAELAALFRLRLQEAGIVVV